VERLDWNDLKFLLAVHRKGSLAASAKALGVTKATVSRRLAALETGSGARLFDRKPTGIELTPAGRELVTAAEETERALASVESRVASASDAMPRGTVRLTAPPWIAARCIIPHLPELSRRYPELDVQLVGSDQILNLAQGEADVALRNVRPHQASLACRKIGELGGCVYASSLYLERRGMPRGRDELASHDVLAYADLGGMPGFEWLREVGRKPVFQANGPEGLTSAVSAGLGLAAIPCLLGDEQSGLVRVESLGFATCELLLVTQEQLRNTPRVRVVSDYVAELISKHRPAIEGRRGLGKERR
jgi:DNA-binding transcriptional LysR family regulator